MSESDVIVIGGGASGMIAAVSAAETGDHVCLLEAQGRPGRKVLASGNGRCNLMNLSSPRYYGDAGFAEQVMRFCPPERIADFWEKNGMKLRTVGDGLVYPCTFQAVTVLDTLTSAMKRNGVECCFHQKVIRIDREQNEFRVLTENDETHSAPRIILATGGPAQPKIGGSVSGPQLLRKFGHTSIPFLPALTPLKTDARSVSGLAGIRVKCRIHIFTDGKETHSETGEVLFTEDGISGICAMQCARFVSPGRSICRMDLIYDLYPEPENAVRDLMILKERIPDEEPTELIRGICVPRLAYAVCKQAGFPLRGEKAGDLCETQIRALVKILTGYTLQILDRKGFEQAQVSAGGLDCKLFRAETMESRLVIGLHCAGETLNVDGDCGGFNLMFAWASGILAGLNGREVRYD